MDSLITAAARALAAGDPLAALNGIALREDAPALALRGIAMAQLGEFVRAKQLLKNAARAFGPKEAVPRARCVVAQAEIALVSRDLSWPTKALEAAGKTLSAHGDRTNAAYAQYLGARRLLLMGRLTEAGGILAGLDPAAMPAALRTVHELLAAGIAIRRRKTHDANAALSRARGAARLAGIPALAAEVETAAHVLQTPAARLIANGTRHLILLKEVEELHASNTLVVDACRHAVQQAGTIISLATRPVLFALARALAEAWPQDVPRDVLLARAFSARLTDESHRARLRVEIGRLRRALHALAEVRATSKGFVLQPLNAPRLAVLAWPLDEEHAEVLALLADGESWSSSALALALGTSQRTVQRALDSLAAARKVQAVGRARARRWVTTPVPGFTTTLLLPVSLPVD